MANFKYCVIVVVFVNVTLFCVFCYLMSTVNPEPSATTSEASQSTKESTTAHTEPSPGIRRMLPKMKKNNYGSKSASNYSLSVSGDLPNNSVIQYMSNNTVTVNNDSFNTKKSIYHRIFEILNNDLDSPGVAREHQKIFNFRINNKSNTTNSSDLVLPTSLPTKRYPVKGLRRSIITEANFPAIDVESDSVLLKIMDHNGYPRTEIKLISVKNSPEKNNGGDNTLKTKAEFNMYVQDVSVSGDLPNNSVIQVMPNNTITVNNDSFIIAKANESLSVFSEFDETIGSSDSNRINVPESSDIPTDMPIFIETENVTVFLADQLDMTESNNYLDTTVGYNVAGDESKLISQNSVINMTALYFQASDVSEMPNTYENVSNVIQVDDEEFDENATFSVSSENVIVSSYLTELEDSENINKTENISSTINSHTLLISDVINENDSSIELTTSNSERINLEIVL